jgi:CRISPR-associated protein Cas1
MTVLYVTQPDAVLSKSYEAFVVARKQPDNTWKKDSVAAQTVEQIVLMGNPQITGDALAYALELGIPVHYLSIFGKYLGSALPGYSRNGALRLAQFDLYRDTERRLQLVKAIVTAKIQNQFTVLYRQKISDSPLKSHKKLVAQKETLDEVRGVEGIAAKDYFADWSAILKEPWSFPGRNRRPPTDPVNSLLSFAYGLLRVQVTAAVHIVGLDPYIGYLLETLRSKDTEILEESRI